MMGEKTKTHSISYRSVRSPKKEGNMKGKGRLLPIKLYKISIVVEFGFAYTNKKEED